MSVPRLAKTRFTIGVVALTAITAIGWLVLWASVVPAVQGWSPVAIVSGSMAPRIDSGDIVLAAPYDGEPLDAGAVIVFDNLATGTGTMTHRVVATTPTGDYVTRGDANGRIDSTPVPPDAIHGVGRILVPTIGTPLVWADHHQWPRFMAAAIIALAALWASRWALLSRHNPWRHRPPPPVQTPITSIGTILGISPTAAPAVVAQTATPDLPPRPPTRTRRGPQRLAVTTLIFASIAGGALVAPSIIRSQAAFTNAPDNTNNSWTADTLNPPTSLTATGGAVPTFGWETRSITLDSTATVDTYATGHRILRSTSPGGPYSQVAEITPRTTTTHDDNPAADTYYYVARAYDLSWESVNSNEASATVASSVSDGTVDTEQKISDTAGGLVASLDNSDYFGGAVTGIGDVDGDGINDIAVGAFFDDDGGTNRGAVYVLFLNADGTVKAEQKISDTAGGLAATLDNSDTFGESVAGIGDLDGDGINDIAVGAWGDDDGGTNRGAVYVLFLNADGTVKAEQKISDTAGGLAAILDDTDEFGIAVVGIGDVDGDGINDIAVGARGDDDGGTGRGAAYVLFLNADGTVKAEQKISDTAGGLAASLDNSDQFGRAVAGIGDLDGDGINDIAVGAFLDDDGGSDRGAVYVLFLNADGTVKAEQKISDTAGGLAATLGNDDRFGVAVAGIGDGDGDGINDIAVGAFFRRRRRLQPGRGLCLVPQR